jgi:guanylate kinase
MNEYKVIAIIGKAGSGKDTILNEFFNRFENKDLIHKIISYTTRPPREKEVAGKDYFFVSNEEFAEKVLNFEMLEATEFRNWHYGTGLGSLDENKVNIGVFNPEGATILMDNPAVELYVMEVRASGKERLIRQLNRESDPNVDEIIRRYGTDELDFDDLDIETYIVFNENEKDFENCMNFLSGVVYTIRPRTNNEEESCPHCQVNEG